MIKRIKILATGALLLAGLGACSPSGKKTGADSTVDTLRTAETVNLLNNLRKVPTQGIMFGHHDDPLYGVGWEGDEDRSDVKSVCGDYPAVMSFDLGHIELEREKSLVAFCVMGGIFSEGIDLTDDKLIGAVIAGTGLPQVCTEREILKQYFNAADMDGFDYAYLYPGMNKVLQSAGRVIRTESDRGVILLLDDRFRAMRYREVFPREWQQYQLGSVKNLEQEIRTFWESP